MDLSYLLVKHDVNSEFVVKPKRLANRKQKEEHPYNDFEEYDEYSSKKDIQHKYRRRLKHKKMLLTDY